MSGKVLHQKLWQGISGGEKGAYNSRENKVRDCACFVGVQVKENGISALLYSNAER